MGWRLSSVHRRPLAGGGHLHACIQPMAANSNTVDFCKPVEKFRWKHQQQWQIQITFFCNLVKSGMEMGWTDIGRQWPPACILPTVANSKTPNFCKPVKEFCWKMTLATCILLHASASTPPQIQTQWISASQLNNSVGK